MNICTNDDFPNVHLSVQKTVSSYVLAPSLTSFVLWVLHEAMKSETKRVYFLARDGYLMYQTAKLLCERLALPVECKYLSCSRYSLRIPAFHLDVEEALNYVCRDSIDVNITKILKRANLTKEERAKVIAEIDMQLSPTEIIPYTQLPLIKKTLRNCPLFLSYMNKHSRETFPSAQGYLLQEGFLDGIKDAIVDSGWVGSTQEILNQLLSKLGRTTNLQGYYWGLYELPRNVQRSEYHSYYFSPEKGLSEKVYFSNSLFEAIFSAPHGMTLRYEKRGESYWPCYATVSEEKRAFILQMEKNICQYTELLLDKKFDISKVDSMANKRIIGKLLKRFMGKPTKQEVEIFGKILFADDVLEDDTRLIAADLNEKELRRHHVFCKILSMLGVDKRYTKESAWYEGSAVRTGHFADYHLFQYSVYKYLLYIRKTYLWRKNE